MYFNTFKVSIIFLTFLLLASPFWAIVDLTEIPPEITSIVTKTFDALKSGDTDLAMKIVAGNGPLAKLFSMDSGSYQTIINNLSQSKQLYGNFESFTILKADSIDGRIYKLLVVCYTENIPLKFDFIFYKNKKKWSCIYFYFSDEILVPLAFSNAFTTSKTL
jgi:hypothetical protein